MSAIRLLKTLRSLGVSLAVDGERLKVTAPRDTLSEELRAQIALEKSALIALLAPDESSARGPTPIPRPPRPRPSLGQERLLSLSTQEPESPRYNLPLAFRVRGPLDPEALGHAVRAVVARHETLRTTVRSEGDTVWLDMSSAPHANVFTVVSAAEVVDVDAWIRGEARRPFDLRDGPLLRVRVLQHDDEDHVITVVMHHFASDGWSFEVFFDELAEAYAAAIDRRATDLPTLPVQYWDVSEWQRSRLEAGGRRRAAAFWGTLYADAPAPLGIPAPDPSGRDGRVKRPVPADVAGRLDALARTESTTPFVISLAAYALLLSAWTQSREVILCTPTSGRDRDEARPLIGYLNNVLPLRLTIHPDSTFRDILRATSEHTARVHAHASLPFQEVALLPETATIPLSRGMFAYHGEALRGLNLRGLNVESIPVAAGTADFDLACSLDGSENGLDVTLVFRQGVLGSATPDEYLNNYFEVLAVACDAPEASAGDLVRVVSLRPIPQGRRPQSTPIGPGETPWTQDAQSFKPPGDPLQLQMSVLWERVLGVRPIPVDLSFLDLGGHSLLAVELLATVEREMGVRLPLSALVEHPTVRDLTRAVHRHGWEPDSDRLLHLAGPAWSEGDPRPIVLVHSFEGHVFLYNELARALGERHPVYGLQAAGLDGHSEAHRSVEEMAAHYLERLDQEFGGAPVALAAICYGVSVALEMAQRLYASGRDVDLVLIDSSWEHFRRPTDPSAMPSVARRLVNRAQRTLTRWRWWLRETVRMVAGTPHGRREARVRRNTTRAWNAYTPEPYPGHLTLIRAQETADDPSKGWQMEALDVVAAGTLTTRMVPGHHFGVLHKPTVTALADRIVEALH